MTPSFVGGRRCQCPGPTPILQPLRLSHQWCHKSHVLVRGPPCAQGVMGTLHGELDNNHQCRSFISSIWLHLQIHLNEPITFYKPKTYIICNFHCFQTHQPLGFHTFVISKNIQLILLTSNLSFFVSNHHICNAWVLPAPCFLGCNRVQGPCKTLV